MFYSCTPKLGDRIYSLVFFGQKQKKKNMVHTEQVLNVELLWWNKNAPFDTEILLTHKQSLKDTHIGQ